MKNLFYALFIIAITLASCAKDTFNEDAVFSIDREGDTHQEGNNCSDYSFEVKTTSLLMPVSKEAGEQMDMSDKLMATPRVSQQFIEITSTDRGLFTKITNLKPQVEEMANSSMAMVNQPTYAYATIDGTGTLHCFGAAGNQIGVASIGIDANQIQSIVNACNLPRLNRKTVDYIFNELLMADQNYTELDADHVMYTRKRENGTSSRIIFDKNYQVENGRVHLDKSGKVISSVIKTFTGPSDNPVPKTLQSSFPMKSMTSAAEFNHVTNREFSNFKKS